MCSHHQKWLFKPLQCSKFFWWLYSLFLTHGASCRLLKRDWAQRQLDGPEIAALALTLLGGQKAWNASEILFLMIPKLDYIDYIKKPKTSDLLTSKNKHPSPRSQLFLGGVLGLPATAEAKRCCGNEQSMASVSKATFPGKNQPQIFDHQRHQGKMSQMWRNNGFFLLNFFSIYEFPFFQCSISCLHQVLAATKSQQPATTCYHAELDSIKIHLVKPAAKLQGVRLLHIWSFCWFLRSTKKTLTTQPLSSLYWILIILYLSLAISRDAITPKILLSLKAYILDQFRR